TMDREAKLREIASLRDRAQRLEDELASEFVGWPPPTFYTTHHVLAGCVFGMFGAATSLLFNIVGSLLGHPHPLQLIPVYLTFPLGESALEVGDGLTLAIGCCLYLGTGILLGVPFQVVLNRYFDRASFAVRFVVTSGVAIAFWLINYYALLAWLQPLFF